MKLSTQDVLDIFDSPESTEMLALAYDVSTNTIRSIKRRRSHRHITTQIETSAGKSRGNRHILDDQTVRRIYHFSGTIKELKNTFGVSKSVANNIKFRYTYREVTEGINGAPGELKLHKLSWDDVCSIRAVTVPSDVVALMYGVSVGTINNIRNGRTRVLK